MKFSCPKDMLAAGISTVQRAVAARSSLPALEGILIEAGETLKLKGYDLEIGIECTLEASVEAEGAVVLASRVFGDIVRRLPGDTVLIDVDEKLLCTIKCGLAEFTILGLPAAEFPELPAVEDGTTLSLPRGKLRGMIRQTLFAVAQNDSKPVHTGSLFDVRGDVLRVVSVDGYRMAVREESIENNTGQSELSFVVPGKALGEIGRLLQDSDEPVDLCLSKNHIMFLSDNFLFISRLLSGEFLNYEKAIPKDGSITVEADVKVLTEAVERASLLISERVKSPVKCSFEYDTVKLTCTTPIGRVQEEFEAKTQGGPIEIGFNNRYMLDALKACEADSVLMQMSTPLSPIVIRPVEGGAFTFLVLPVRLKSE